MAFHFRSFIAEESFEGKTVLTDSPTWIIDPVDGTMNFVHSFPHSCISIALFVNKVNEIGIIYNPILKQLFTARRGQGAYYNGKRIQASGRKDWSRALITCEFATYRDAEKLEVSLDNFRKILSSAQG